MRQYNLSEEVLELKPLKSTSLDLRTVEGLSGRWVVGTDKKDVRTVRRVQLGSPRSYLVRRDGGYGLGNRLGRPKRNSDVGRVEKTTPRSGRIGWIVDPLTAVEGGTGGRLTKVGSSTSRCSEASLPSRHEYGETWWAWCPRPNVAGTSVGPGAERTVEERYQYADTMNT